MAREKNKIEIPVAQAGELKSRLILMREEAGYSISQLADALCLSEDVVQNLEDENFEKLAEPPYIRGYLRNYAKLGGQDPKEIIALYESLRGADASEFDFHMGSSLGTNLSAHKKGASPVMVQLIFLAALLLGIAGLSMVPAVNQWFKESWSSLSSQFLSPSADSADKPDLIGTLPVPLPLIENEEVTSSNETTAEEVSQKEGDLEEKSLTEGIQNSAGSNTQTENAQNAEPPKSSDDKNEEKNTADKINDSNNPEKLVETSVGEIALKLVFNKDVWLRIRDNKKKTVFEGLNKAGTNKSLQLEKPLTFRVGNAQGLSLFVNDKAIDISSYINGSIANFTLE
ncbi:MAG: RodZ domain-containing protein [Cocleimonas sp.]